MLKLLPDLVLNEIYFYIHLWNMRDINSEYHEKYIYCKTFYSGLVCETLNYNYSYKPCVANYRKLRTDDWSLQPNDKIHKMNRYFYYTDIIDNERNLSFLPSAYELTSNINFKLKPKYKLIVKEARTTILIYKYKHIRSRLKGDMNTNNYYEFLSIVGDYSDRVIS